jgi:hypothetical protein
MIGGDEICETLTTSLIIKLNDNDSVKWFIKCEQ